MELAFAFTVVAVLAVIFLIGNLVLWKELDVERARVRMAEEDAARQEFVADAAVARERALYQQFVDTLKEMRKEGFQTVPSDEQWPTGGYSLTPEQEAQIERDRVEGVGRGATFGLADTGPVPRARPTPARSSLRIEE